MKLNAACLIQERAAILRRHAQRLPLAPGMALDAIGADCVGYTGADLAALCRQAAMRALTSGAVVLALTMNCHALCLWYRCQPCVDLAALCRQAAMRALTPALPIDLLTGRPIATPIVAP